MWSYCTLLVSMCCDEGFFFFFKLKLNLCVDLGSLWAGPADKSTPDWPYKWGPAGRLVPGQCVDLGAGARTSVYVPQSPLALQRRGWWQSGGWDLPERNTGYWKMYNTHTHTRTSWLPASVFYLFIVNPDFFISVLHTLLENLQTLILIWSQLCLQT